ncbi:hypothetical protein PRIPAC_83268 [Pristionchus pacificus]|uniref:Uncharacterized protein n=1 Tax=Pristionchus pacificus TaxID=54126 RepID=A0A2A6BNV3_PRIPA|nr:hypothetical protein PRIPAC_83268 [Pristionchus pacificus]|eukprot:PDM67463.1 hypothetical protein PRIPAC_48880 [Pristionchus pacificus]
MVANSSLRYGFDWDRDYLIGISMQYQFYLQFFSLLLHPIMQYLLIFENKCMRLEIRVLHACTHFKFSTLLASIMPIQTYREFEIHMISQTFQHVVSVSTHPQRVVHLLRLSTPYAALYCEGPLCRAGMNKQILAITADRLACQVDKLVQIHGKLRGRTMDEPGRENEIEEME